MFSKTYRHSEDLLELSQCIVYWLVSHVHLLHQTPSNKKGEWINTTITQLKAHISGWLCLSAVAHKFTASSKASRNLIALKNQAP